MRSSNNLFRVFLAGAVGFLVQTNIRGTQADDKPVSKGTETHEARTIAGWVVKVNKKLLQKDRELTEKTMVLLKGQLDEVNRVVPAAALKEIQKVTIWVSPEYPGVPPRAEYHPSEGWLRKNGRDPAMAKAVEITDVRNFESECKRMPMLMLHELAHAYHDRVLGFDHPAIRGAYERARESGKYDKVERKFADGKTRIEKAYAMTNAQEYFAECSEAFFGVNDWYPYTLDQLKKHDPDMVEVLEKVWNNPPAKKGNDKKE